MSLFRSFPKSNTLEEKLLVAIHHDDNEYPLAWRLNRLVHLGWSEFDPKVTTTSPAKLFVDGPVVRLFTAIEVIQFHPMMIGSEEFVIKNMSDYLFTRFARSVGGTRLPIDVVVYSDKLFFLKGEKKEYSLKER